MDALGRFLDSTSLTEKGSFNTSMMAAEVADVSVVMRKTCTTWKAKYACCTNSSTKACEGTPATLAQPRSIQGTAAISQVRARAGSRPWMTPKMGPGRSLIHDRKKTISLRESMLLIMPTNTAGMDQKMMAAVITPIMKKRRIMCSHQRIRRALQMISSGWRPM